MNPVSLDFARTPALAKKGLARYDAPVFRLGRLAVATSTQGRGLGGAMIYVNDTASALSMGDARLMEITLNTVSSRLSSANFGA